MPTRLRHGGGLGGGVEEVALEAVERLDRELMPPPAAYSAAWLWTSAAAPSSLGRVGPAPENSAERLVERAASRSPPSSRRAVDRPADAVERARRRPGRGITESSPRRGRTPTAGGGEPLVRDERRPGGEMRESPSNIGISTPS